ncbi:MAG: acyltransferase [Luteolibacter sp.]|uniref:acyltransferase family protein n=1 Tax=Luteolibacter sp. TaxID=1962973 RepID=UPI0032646737
MKSSSGKHYANLDHIRALAAFMVFSWHFLLPEAKANVPLAPFSIFAEGHTGVALFMTLSGYLFAKLLNGKRIDYPKFIWNRVLRLLPLLCLVILIVGVIEYLKDRDVMAYAKGIVSGILGKGFPNGGWSIAIEFHFYVILPLLLWLDRRNKVFLPLLIVMMIALRSLIWLQYGEVQEIAYQTLAGRMDQFVIGIMAFHWRSKIVGKHAFAAVVFGTLAGFYYFFDRAGGFYGLPAYPSPSVVWVFIPTIEALAYGTLIAWYAESFEFKPNRFLWLIGKAGVYSYSIYLLHFFFFHKMSRAAIKSGIPIENFYVGLMASLFFFLCMVLIGHVSYKFIEQPFLRFRKPYILD